ncbi:hypothetical protein GCM10008090_00440 [Arenicella chitinivorans]|uniref:Uncharacterized protein n=1 Tax=Arenicella chitinivorans TaxID=1329800 RepID=A0A918RDW9_9GAMM|nr:hypothetical protein [Arenicella chitinivorans]GGZ96155.1 hypothetical protein GCM10008090_00440 [Arenicella chitinivorans]
MGTALHRADFKPTCLSCKTSALVSEFALILFRRTGRLINVYSDDAIYDVLEIGARCADRRLQCISLHLYTELCNKILEVSPDRSAFTVDKDVRALLSEKATS